MNLKSKDYGLRAKDDFQILRQFQFHSNHIDILNRLFTPLIGSSSTGLYIYLDQFSEQTSQAELTHYTIMSELKINLLDFRKQMDVLEAIGLVKTYVHHDTAHSHFVYELIQPPTGKQFFDDPMLSVFLYSEVGHQRYHQLKHFFASSKKQVDLSQFTEITRKYTDVFNIPHQRVPETDIEVTEAQTYQGLNLSDVEFDFEVLYDLLQTHFISSKIIGSQTKQLITQLATLYGLTPEAMKSIILKSLTSDQELSFEELRKHARTYYLMEHDQQLPKIQVKQPPQTKKQSETNKETHKEEDELKPGSDRWLELLDNTSPIEMLASWSESEPTDHQKRMVEELIEREKLSFGVINILLQYVMLKEDMKLPKNYIMEIASNWKKKGYTTAKQAYQQTMQQETKKKEKKAQPQRNYRPQYQHYSRELTPEWLKNRDQRDQQSKASSEEEHDEQFEKERQAFLKDLQQTWNGGKKE
ncbi:replication initiation and membrane attachment family protein [Staphylococcus argensis]|uniref:Helicase DnaB n=1 Tax=Staphylococcus argensis TaxID=1607738 RepID=A0A2K4FFV7_9STAP|nr:DnaD domain protein [Staphylococcus argensis]MCY6990685.1 DnaD domain protein [Staphylococcus argensis]POA10187.1 helicase DnaB [Staphylococcus argensis]